ncbi:MAG: insulinase family protein [candidate division KSB1 bacterium]|nr:insulinase family protein [candidate division KSB1 bacterium]
MRRLSAIGLWTLVLGGVMVPQVQAGFFPYAYEVYRLPNGLSAILIPMPGSGLVAYYSVVRTGSRDEWEPHRSGFAHFFEHMMFRGTKKYPGEVYDRLVTEMGASANAYTTDDYTCYYMVAARENLEQVMELESDRFQNLNYDETAFKTEAGAVYGEYRKGRVNPWWVLEEELLNTAFDVHTYKHTTIGFEEDIQLMPTLYEYSLSFFRRYYRPDNVVLLIAGDFDKEGVKSLLNKYYGSWEPGYVPPQIQPEPDQKAERFKEVRYNGRTLPILAIGYKGAAFDPQDKMVAAAYVLGELAFGENSEIYKKLVVREQKVQFIQGDFGFNRDPKLYVIYTMVKKEEDIPYVRDQIDATATKFREELVSEEELEKVKSHMTYGFLMELDTPGHVAGNLAPFVALTGGIEAVDQLLTTIQSLRPEDVREAARRFLQNERRTVILLKGVK